MKTGIQIRTVTQIFFGMRRYYLFKMQFFTVHIGFVQAIDTRSVNAKFRQLRTYEVLNCTN